METLFIVVIVFLILFQAISICRLSQYWEKQNRRTMSWGDFGRIFLGDFR
jgi:hypothetical protein